MYKRPPPSSEATTSFPSDFNCFVIGYYGKMWKLSEPIDHRLRPPTTKKLDSKLATILVAVGCVVGHTYRGHHPFNQPPSPNLKSLCINFFGAP